MALYEIRRDGQTMAQSEMPNLGYTPERLRQMEQGGYCLYMDGKPAKKRRTKTGENSLNPPG